jgi:hypothetical protein
MPLHCDNAASVIKAIERGWRENQTPKPQVFHHLATQLNTKGYVTDGDDDLKVLDHCRQFRLPVVDVVAALEEKVREAGYRGGFLSLADCSFGSKECYVFFDSRRFPTAKDISGVIARLRDGTG